MPHSEFQKIIDASRQFTHEPHWTGTCLDYLEKVRKNPEIAQLAPGRVFNMIMNKGTENITDPKLPGYEDMVRYDFFKNDLFGLEEPLHDLMRFFKAGARRTETGKRILILVGPVSSGKSTIASMLKAGLENDPTPIYAIKGCPIHEEPLHLIPNNQRAKWEEILGVRIEGDLCPMCRYNLLNGDYKDADNNILWETFPVVEVKLSERGRLGIGTFQPSDPKNQDIAELIGRIDLSKITQYGETDPRAYSLDGELEIANRGLIEYIEILKCDVKFHYVLLSVAQEQVLKAPGFPQIYVDEVLLSHTNQTEFEKFKSVKENEALHDRMYPIFVPYNMRVRDEEKISKKLIERSEFKGLHLAPYTLTVAAQFAILTRLTPSQILPNLIKKMKYYNGEAVSDQEKGDQVDIAQLRLEGRKNGEGMSGISPRFVVNALNVILGEKEGVGCLNPLDTIRGLRYNFEHHIGFSDEEKQRYLNLLLGEKDSVLSEYKEIAKKEVNRAFLFAYEDQAQALFDNYMKNATAYCLKKKIRDPITGDEQEPDEKLMRSIEEMIGVSENSKAEFRQGLFVFKSDAQDQGKEFTFNTYTPLQEAIERKLIGDLKNVVSLTIADKTRKDPKTMKRRQDAMEILQQKGYCPVCAENLLQFVGDLLRKEE